MKYPSLPRSRTTGALVGAVGCALLGMALFLTVLGGGLERGSFDWLFARKPVFTPDNILLVSLDDESHTALNQPKNAPWNRALHAELIERLHRAGARLVVFDILFDTAGRVPATDDRLAAAVKASGRVILCGDKVRNGPKATLDPPLPMFASAARGWGLSTLVLDPDMAVRRYEVADMELPLLGVPAVPSLAWVAVQAVVAQDERPLPRPPQSVWLNYHGPPGTLRGVSFHQALDTNATPDALFRNKVVFVGARRSVDFSGAGKDEFGTPFTGLTGTFSSGVEIHATAFLNLLRREWLVRLPGVAEGLLVLAAAAGFGAGLVLLRPRFAVALAGAGAALVVLAAYWLFTRHGVWFGWLVLLVQIAAALGWAALFHLYLAHVDNLLLNKLLSLHLPPARVKQALRNPEMRRPGGQKQELAFLFTDLDYFSTLAERMPTERLFGQLNKYFGRAITCIHDFDGTMMRLTGDGVFAIWNAPVAQPDYALQALRAALALRDRLRELETEGVDFPLHTRIGVHAGEACVGNCGSHERMDYTAIGANVNVASRLEGLNKYLHTEILASDEIVALAGPAVVTRRVGSFRLKGCDRVLHVHEVVALAGSSEPAAPWLASFQEGLRHFQRRRFPEAERAFHQTLLLRPKDGPSEFYLKQVRQMDAAPESDTWFGEVIMLDK